jgi:hypothetical protein
MIKHQKWLENKDNYIPKGKSLEALVLNIFYKNKIIIFRIIIK